MDSINLGKYLRELLINLNNSYGQEKNVEIDVHIEKVGVDVSKAIPCGLIANEILTNSLKHAFQNDIEKPKLELSVSNKDNRVELIFRDNGIGYDSKRIEKGMGLELINDLTEQIDGVLKIGTENGVSYQLSFPTK